MKKALIGIGIVVALLLIFLMMGPLYIVNEGYQVVITRFGQITAAHTESGLYFKVPFVDIVTTYPKLILSMDGDSQRIQTKENQFIIADTTSRWKITDPALFYQSFKTLDAAYTRLSDIIDSATRTIITQHRLSEIVRSSNIINETNSTDPSLELIDDASGQLENLINMSSKSESVKKGRRQLTIEMVEEADKMLSSYGIELIDILPRQIKYSDEMTESVYNRMIKERNQVAQAYRSLGQGKRAEWLGKLENDQQRINSTAKREAQEIMGNADAEASRIYADAYSADPEFYTFWQSLESYKKTIPQFDATFSTSMDYFKYMYNSKGNR